MNYFAESFAVFAMLINFVGYRQKDMNRYRLISGIAMLCLGTHFLLLDALAAAIGCYLAFFRNLISMVSQRGYIVLVFLALNIAFLLFELIVLQHGFLIILAYSASIIFTLGTFVLSNTQQMRRYFLVAETFNIIYAISVGSVMGTVGISLSIISITSKMWQERKHNRAHSQVYISDK
ncbi:MAG: YgjV family protein [Alteromonadaceae bacterium]|nr:YgjV family protein [Alteromonadaceae bacterium]